jgi:DinB family
MKLLLSLLFSICFFTSTAQNSLNETLKQLMIKDWERARAYTQEYLDAMPAGKYGFRAVDSIRSFSEQMLHLARANVGMASIGTGIQNAAGQNIFFRPDFEISPTAQSKDSVVFYVNTSYEFVINAIKNMDFGKAEEVVSRDMPGGKRSASRLAWLLKAFEHQTHHRGQCTIYLRLLGIRPPGEKLW